MQHFYAEIMHSLFTKKGNSFGFAGVPPTIVSSSSSAVDRTAAGSPKPAKLKFIICYLQIINRNNNDYSHQVGHLNTPIQLDRIGLEAIWKCIIHFDEMTFVRRMNIIYSKQHFLILIEITKINVTKREERIAMLLV